MDIYPSLFQQQVTTRSSDIAIRIKRHGLWHSWTWAQMGVAVHEIACGLAAKGLKPNEKVAIIGNNIPELYFGTIATQCLGAVSVPIHPDSGPEELVSFLNNCEAKIALVQDQQQVDALMAVMDQCPNLVEVIYKDERGMHEYDHAHLNGFAELQSVGKHFSADHPNFLADVAAKVTQESDAFILYTSGTSGQTRGALHTHGSVINTAKAFADTEHIKQDEEVLAFMPMSYAANALFTYTLWILKGFTINCPESNDTVMTDLREVGPTILYAPPHFYKQLHAEITSRGQRSATYWFTKWFKIARDNREKFINGEQLSFSEKFKWGVGDWLMYKPLKNVFGLSNLRKAYNGGDMMNSEVFNFLRSIGVHIKKSYGTTESAGFICIQGWDQLNNPSGEYMMGTPLPGVEIKLFEDGEIAFRGINAFKEYYRDPEATSTAIDADGWVRTGDKGKIDDNGALKITDRVDAIGQFSHGELFAPHLIENALKSSPYIKEAFALGEGKDVVAAFIVIDGDTVGSWAEANNVRFTGYRDLSTKDEVYDLVDKTVLDVNAHMGQIEGEGTPPIKRFLIMYREFNVGAGEITRSRKIRRDVIMEKHNDLVDALYSSQQTYQVKDVASGEIVAEIKLKTE